MATNLDEIERTLLDLVQKSVPKASTLQKYGGTLFTLRPEEKEGQFCGVFTQKNNVKLSFSDGALLDDPEKLLQGSGKGRRHINFNSVDEIKKTYLTKLLKQAAKFSITHVQ